MAAPAAGGPAPSDLEATHVREPPEQPRAESEYLVMVWPSCLDHTEWCPARDHDNAPGPCSKRVGLVVTRFSCWRVASAQRDYGTTPRSSPSGLTEIPIQRPDTPRLGADSRPHYPPARFAGGGGTASCPRQGEGRKSRNDRSAGRGLERSPLVLRAGRLRGLLPERGPPLIAGIVTEEGVPAIGRLTHRIFAS